MNSIFLFSIYMSVLGAISSLIGGFLGAIICINKKSVISFLYEVTAGIMTGIVCFEMLPECFEISSISYSIFGIIIGTILIFLLDYVIRIIKIKNTNNNKKIVSLVIILSMAFHNAIEGFAIGSSYVYSSSFGFVVLLGMFLHDIPEGMIVGITSKVNGKKIKKIAFESILVGACVGIGTLLGGYIGNIDNKYISLSLSMAAGAMLYIVSCELIPESKENSKNKLIYLTYVLGILIGAIISKV